MGEPSTSTSSTSSSSSSSSSSLSSSSLSSISSASSSSSSFLLRFYSVSLFHIHSFTTEYILYYTRDIPILLTQDILSIFQQASFSITVFTFHHLSYLSYFTACDRLVSSPLLQLHSCLSHCFYYNFILAFPIAFIET